MASPDGRTLATVHLGRFYDLATGKENFASPGWVSDLQFLPGGRTLVTNERDLWDAATGEKLRGLDVRRSAAVSPDGKHFVDEAGRRFPCATWRLARNCDGCRRSRWGAAGVQLLVHLLARRARPCRPRPATHF
jgi:hypothetical protein